MQRFKNILVIYNSAVGDEAMLTRATELAKKNQAQLTVATVLEELGADVRKMGAEERRQYLERLIATVRHDGIQAKIRVLEGTPFLEITREVLREGHDLVIMSTERPLGLKKVLLGSTSMHLMRKCPCPVWVMKPGPRRRSMRILAAVAPDLFNQERDALNTTIMDLASSLAEREQAELHVVHIWHIASGYRLRRPSGITTGRQNEWDRTVREHHKTALFNLLDAYKKHTPGRVHLVKSWPGTLIPKLAAKEEIDLVVMGTVCRTGVPGFFMGNTAESILQQVVCSVLTLKPDGFVTPVA